MMRPEETSVSPQKKRNAIKAAVLNVISFVLFAAFVPALIYCVFCAPSLILFALPILALSLLSKYLSARADVSFDYSVGDGVFVICKVINDRKRKEKFAISAQEILRVSEIKEHTGERKDKKTVFCTANDSPPEGKVFLRLETKDKLIIVEGGEKLAPALMNKVFY